MMRALFLPAVIPAMTLSGCMEPSRLMTPVTAQPKTPVARNFTSFQPALQCMDGLLKKSGKRGVRLTSTGIPDHTLSVRVAADDMLISAISQMNRKSRAYVFLDQALIKEGSLREVQVNLDDITEDQPRPHYYIRGSISQLDNNARSTNASLTYEPHELPDRQGMTSSRAAPNLGNSVVSVDLHLVAYPSRQVLAGASVSNSMVVSRTNWGAGLTGMIPKGDLGISLQINRVESAGQAVRNLVELGVIELLGRHADVPYWQCLSLPDTNARQRAGEERNFIRSDSQSQLEEAQSLLITLQRLPEPASGRLDANTRRALSRFQAEHVLIASGRPDFDTINALRKAVAALQPQAPLKPLVQRRKVPAPAPPPAPAPARRSGDGSYQSLSDFLQ